MGNDIYHIEYVVNLSRIAEPLVGLVATPLPLVNLDGSPARVLAFEGDEAVSFFTSILQHVVHCPVVAREQTPPQVEHKPQCLIDGSEFVAPDAAKPTCQAFIGHHPELVAACVRRVVQPADPRLDLDVASQPVGSGGDRNDNHKPAGSVVEDVG